MKRLNDRLAKGWAQVSPRLLPFADAATPELPLGRLLRLSLFQLSVAITIVLLNGTLNRVMIVELDVPAFLVASMVSVPLLFAPLRALIGHKSDTHRSFIGWRRAPFIWIGSLLQFGGLAIMPFALLIMSGDTTGPTWIGTVGAALAFLLTGAGLHTTQTAGLALATDLAPAHARPRVVAFLFVMLLAGMVAASFAFGLLLADFGPVRLVQVIQGAAVVTVACNVVALWKQEARDPSRTRYDVARPTFKDAWASYREADGAIRALVALALGTAAFSMQDILLEPYGGEILKLSVGETTALTGLFALGAIAGFLIAAIQLGKGADPYRIAGIGVVAGLLAFPAVIAAAPLQSANLFRAGTMLIGFGSGLFAVGTLTAAMALSAKGSGLALGAWGAVQATATGIAVGLGGALRDVVSKSGAEGSLGPAMTDAASAYNAVYHLEILLLFATLAAIGPLVRPRGVEPDQPTPKFGLAEFPG